MKQEHAATLEADSGARADIPTRLVALEEQGRQILELTRRIVGLLLPQEDSRERVTLEDLIADMVAMQRDVMIVARATQVAVTELSERLPTALADAVGDRQSGARLA